MTVQPTAARKALINTVIAGLKADSLWDSLAVFAFPAAHDSQAGLLNWVQNSGYGSIASRVNSCAFTTDRGYAGNSSGQRYINLNFNPVLDSSKFKYNNMAFGAYVNSGSGGTYGFIGDSVASSFRYQISFNSGKYEYRLGKGSTTPIDSSTYTGMFWAQKRSFTNKTLFRNAWIDTTVTETGATNILNGSFLLCRDIGAGTFSTVRIAWYGIGLSLSPYRLTRLYYWVNYYLTQIGAN